MSESSKDDLKNALKNENEFKNSPKIDLSQKRIQVVFDSKTKSIISAFDNMNKANLFVRKLVKIDLKMIIDDLKLKINLTDSDDDEEKDNTEINRERLQALQTLIFQYDNFEQSKNASFIYGNRTIVRYFIYNIPYNNEVSEPSYTLTY